MSAAIDANKPSAIFKGFVEVNGGMVHYVRRGEGPALVMLHAAPCSAKVMAPRLMWPYPGLRRSRMARAGRS